jgi:hypothetical protein
LKVMRAIEVCRTAELGGHVERCDRCGFETPAYNSCRNRHCPKCQAFAKAKWLEARKADLLPVGYFHVVFTIPHQLNALAVSNKRVVYDILFRAASRTLRQFGADPKHGLGGRIGFTAVLHTWDQQLRYHLHLHCLVAGGALSADGQRWIPARERFLFPVRALSRVFRGKFLHLLQEAFDRRELHFPGIISPLRTHERLAAFTAQLRQKDWVVYAKRPFTGPEGVLDYLGRYTQRVAISNERITRVGDGKVTFTWRDRSDQNKRKPVTLEALEFIRRFLLHLLPESYVRVRHFGLLSARSKGRDLPRCRQLLGHSPCTDPVDQCTTEELMLLLTGRDLTRCPQCRQGTMCYLRELPPLRFRSARTLPRQPPDTS